MTASAHRTARRRFLGARSGMAAVEFALLGPAFVLMACLLVDLGFAYFVRLRIANATTAAAIYAQSNGQSVTASTAAAFLDGVRAVAQNTLGLPQTPTISVTFNNATDGSAAGTYYCVSGYPATWTSMGSVAGSCAGGVTAGKFVTIAISVNRPALLVRSDAWGAMSDTKDFAMVRVK